MPPCFSRKTEERQRPAAGRWVFTIVAKRKKRRSRNCTTKKCPRRARYEPRFCQMGVAERPCQPGLRSRRHRAMLGPPEMLGNTRPELIPKAPGRGACQPYPKMVSHRPPRFHALPSGPHHSPCSIAHWAVPRATSTAVMPEGASCCGPQASRGDL